MQPLESDVTSIFFAYRTRPEERKRELDKLHAYYSSEEGMDPAETHKRINAKHEDLESRYAL